MSIENRIENIKNKWFLTEPIYFMVLCTHNVEFDSQLGCSICCGQGSIFINPTYFEKLPDEILEDLIKVELIRILLKHPYSRQQPIKEYSYLASNIIIANNTKFENIYLADSIKVFGYKEPKNESLEYYYSRLVDKFPPKENNDLSNGSGGTSSEDGSSNYDKFDDCCESMKDAAAKTSKWQEDELKTIEINRLIENVEASNSWGNIPGGIVDEIKKSIIPKFDYRAVFQQFRSTLISSKRCATRMRPNRRFGYMAMGSKREFTTKILVAVDTSGSISDNDLFNAAGFIKGFFTYGVETIDAIEFDTKIYPETLKTFTKKFKRMKVKGRGGTDFNDVFEYVGKSKVHYDGVIIFTDGCASVPEKRWLNECHTKILWCINSEDNYNWFKKQKGFKQFGKITYIK